MPEANSDSVLLVYMTASSREEAETISRALILEKLAACVNTLGEASSIYEWEGRVEQTREFTMVAKTTKERFSTLLERVKELHSYDCPCVIAVPVSHGYPPFLKWIAESVASADHQ